MKYSAMNHVPRIVTIFLCTTQFESSTLKSLLTLYAYGLVMWLCCRWRVILWPCDPDCELYLKIRQRAGQWIMPFGSQPSGHCDVCVNIILIPISFSSGLNAKLHEKKSICQNLVEFNYIKMKKSRILREIQNQVCGFIILINTTVFYSIFLCQKETNGGVASTFSRVEAHNEVFLVWGSSLSLLSSRKVGQRERGGKD